MHVHFKIRSAAGAVTRIEFTSQLYFDDAVTDAVYAQAPYNIRGRRRHHERARRRLRQRRHRSSCCPSRPDGAGYAGTFDIALLM